MSVDLRASANVLNGTAGTSVVVARPAGTVAGDFLVALIAVVGTPTITAPAGWTLIGTQTAAGSSTARLAAYQRLANGSEPMSWTWTLSSSQLAWGWVGAYVSADPDAPLAATVGTSRTGAGAFFIVDGAQMSRPEGRLISAVASVRTANGSATTWTAQAGEVITAPSTNVGTGTDLSGCVAHETGDGPYVNPDTRLFASQVQSAGAMWSIAIAPMLVPYSGGHIPLILEAAWGADPDADPAGWVWSPLTGLQGDVTITAGLGPDTMAAMAPSTNVSFVLKNSDGRYTPDNPLGANWPEVVADVPIRVSVPYGYAPPTELITVFAESWTPSWDPSTRAATVQVQAYGRLQREQGTTAPLASVLRQAIEASEPAIYWPGEDGSNAGQAAATRPYQQPLRVVGDVSFGAASDCPGSGPLPTLAAGAELAGPVPRATAGRWCVAAVLKLPSTPVSSTTTLMRAASTGTASRWRIDLQPASPDEMYIRVTDTDGTLLSEMGFGTVEAEIYGQWIMLVMSARQVGANVDYEVTYYTADQGSGASNTATSQTCGAATLAAVVAGTSTAGMAAGHLAVWTALDFDPAAEILEFATIALTGRTRELPVDRFARLCTERGIPYLVYDSAETTRVLMGPQPVGALAAQLERCAATDQGLVHDAAPGGALAMVTRGYRYNRPTTMTVAVDRKELAPPLAPTHNTRSRVSDSTVARDGGSSGRYVDTTIRGARAEQVTVSLPEDGLQAQIAGHRVSVLGIPGMRYPGVPINLRRTPGLVPDWLGCRVGSRIQVTGLWAGHGPTPVDQLMGGYVQRIGKTRWEVTPHTYPASPYTVGVRDDGDLARRDTAGSTLAVALTGSTPAVTAWDFTGTSGLLGWTAVGGTVAISGGALLCTPSGAASVEARSPTVPVTVGATCGGSATATCAVSRTVTPILIWRSGTGTLISSTSGTPVSVTAGVPAVLAVTGGAPVGSAQAQLSLSMGGTPPVTNTLSVDVAQLAEQQMIDLVNASLPWTQVPVYYPLDLAVGGERVRASSAGAQTPGATLYTWDTTVEGWAGEGTTTVARVTSPVHDGAGALQISKVMGAGTDSLRCNNADGTLVDRSGVGAVLSAWMLVPIGAAGVDWMGHIELQDTSFTWQAGPDVLLTPGVWTLVAYRPPTSLLTACRAIGVQITATGVNGSQSVYIDTMRQLSTQTITISQRAVNGVSRSWPAGTPVRLWTPARRAL